MKHETNPLRILSRIYPCRLHICGLPLTHHAPTQGSAGYTKMYPRHDLSIKVIQGAA